MSRSIGSLAAAERPAYHHRSIITQKKRNMGNLDIRCAPVISSLAYVVIALTIPRRFSSSCGPSSHLANFDQQQKNPYVG